MRCGPVRLGRLDSRGGCPYVCRGGADCCYFILPVCLLGRRCGPINLGRLDSRGGCSHVCRVVQTAVLVHFAVKSANDALLPM